MLVLVLFVPVCWLPTCIFRSWQCCHVGTPPSGHSHCHMLTARQVSLKFLGHTDGEVGTGWMGEEIIRQLVLLHGTGRWHACTSKLLWVSARPACTMEAPPSVTKREMSSAAPSALIVAQALSALAPPLTGGKPQIDRFADWCPACVWYVGKCNYSLVLLITGDRVVWMPSFFLSFFFKVVLAGGGSPLLTVTVAVPMIVLRHPPPSLHVPTSRPKS